MKIPKILTTVLTALSLSAFAGNAQAAPIVGGSALLDGASVAQLETWLGQGPIQLTNIFTKGVGSTDYDFHTAADNQGPTFTVLEAFKYGNRYLIGGYNPQYWSDNGYHITDNDADRTGFLFNLTSTTVMRQDLGINTSPYVGSDTGRYQTYNGPGYGGPIFGGGWDLRVYNDLNTGYAFNWSYCAEGQTGCAAYYGDGANIIGISGTDFSFDSVGGLEVFTFTEASDDVPTPGALALLGLGLLCIGRLRRKKFAA